MSTNPADAYAERVRREREENPIQIKSLDDNVLTALPEGTGIISVVPSGASAWCETFRIDARLRDEETKSYFLKVSCSWPQSDSSCQHYNKRIKYESGEAGRTMMEGKYQSELAYASFSPCNAPKPIAFGEFEPNTAYGSTYVNFTIWSTSFRTLNLSSGSRYHHFANIPNENTWQDSWETWFTQAMKSMYEFEKQTQGEDEELESLFGDLSKKGIPRLLRSLETDGRSVEPCLVHSDLWPGNCMPDADTGELMVFDSCAFWGHNEANLGP
ncbi:MAG: hypothetical protein M1820_002877 [Bogoriella megaspora]|nr:MAG: hypothetical protein M1820_002877 [Bogoriella megaspora]